MTSKKFRKIFYNHFSRAGFSLIELMLTVAIIGVLAAIAIPNYQAFAKKAKASLVQTQVGNISSAVQALYALYGHYPNTLSQWTEALPYSTEYPIDCTTISYGLGADDDQEIRDLCAFMSPLDPTAANLPPVNPACAEPRGYLYRGDGINYNVLGYCFDALELAQLMPNTVRCAGAVCWGVTMYSSGGGGW